MRMKNVLAGIMAAVLVIAGVAFTSAGEAKAAEVSVKQGVEYEQRTVDGKTPTMDGYFFGGWYEKGDGTGKALTSVSNGQSLYAKFVPAHVMSVKSQNLFGTAATNNQSGSTSVRFLSAVDCEYYREVGFKIDAGNIAKQQTVSTPKVYDKIYVKADDNEKYYQAPSLFGTGAKYVTVLEMGRIPESAWGKEFYVRPYWITNDGTMVEGLAKYVRIEDGLNKYITVPVNLTTAEAVAAGLVNVTYNKDVLDFAGYVKGRVFEEALANESVDGTVKCVANVSDISKDNTADDMYIGLRFKIASTSYKLGQGQFLEFKVSGVDFCNKDEGTVNLNVWNFQY